METLQSDTNITRIDRPGITARHLGPLPSLEPGKTIMQIKTFLSFTDKSRFFSIFR
jgi:hypothetical protein